MDWVILNLAVFGAAAVQSATGIGFGVIAGPILLMTLDSAAAVQITIFLSLLIALALAPSLWRESDRPILRSILIGTTLGLPIGIVIYLHANVGLLQLLAGVSVSVMALSVRAIGAGAAEPGSPPPSVRPIGARDVGVGIVSGIMSSTLATPGPPVAAWMAREGFAKKTIRSTVITLFVPSYVAAAVLQATIATTSVQTVSMTAKLVPATLAGLLCGHWSSARIGDELFRRIVVILLWATAFGLLVCGVGRLVP